MRVLFRITRIPRAASCAFICVAAAWTSAGAGEVARPDARIVVTYEAISDLTASRLADKLAVERPRVRAWWGPTFEGEIRVDVQLRYRITRALVPAWRGERGVLEHPARRPLRRATLHELVHIYAPSANRFLAEGLAVYAQSQFGSHPAHPNFGADLHALAVKLRDRADIEALDRIAAPTQLELKGSLASDEAYIVAGSFVRFLIESYGLDRFRALYALSPLEVRRRDNPGDPGRWAGVYGKSLGALGVEWRAALDRFAAAGTNESGPSVIEPQD